MGSIAGILSVRRKFGDINKEIIKNMIGQLKHRAVHLFDIPIGYIGVIAAGYIHESEGTRIVARDSGLDVHVVMDGEIFFCSTEVDTGRSDFSDAETILKLYLEKGDQFVRNIDGNYGIAIWDGREKKLLLARDRVGYIPLFYAKSDDAIVFASEIKAIMQSGQVAKSINLQTVNRFLSYGYVPGPDTLFHSVKQVKPGHTVVFKDGKISENPYWTFRYRQKDENRSDHYYVDQFLQILKDAVARRRKRHPECGAFLSGGLDSSAVVAVMHELKQERFKVFTGGFEEERYNEYEDARIVADHLGLEHMTVTIGFSEDFPQLLEKIVWHHDAPFADTSAIPSYHAARFARDHVDTVLTGDFPDQVLGGSGHHAKALALLNSDSWINRFLRTKMINSLITGVPWDAGGTSFFDRIKRKVYRISFPIEEQRIILDMPVPELLKRCLYTQDFLSVNKQEDPLLFARSFYGKVSEYGLLDKLLYFDTLSYAPDDLMVKVERMTMANGLKAFSPFHDRELVEFMATLPSNMKIRGEARKYVLREAVRPMLPKLTLEKKKKGFDMPIGEWMIRKFPDYVRDLLFDNRTMNRGYFNRNFLQKMVEGFLKGKTDYASGSEGAIISLITLELWHRVFIDG